MEIPYCTISLHIEIMGESQPMNPCVYRYFSDGRSVAFVAVKPSEWVHSSSGWVRWKLIATDARDAKWVKWEPFVAKRFAKDDLAFFPLFDDCSDAVGVYDAYDRRRRSAPMTT